MCGRLVEPRKEQSIVSLPDSICPSTEIQTILSLHSRTSEKRSHTKKAEKTEEKKSERRRDPNQHLVIDVVVMVRRIPTNEEPLTHPVLSFSLLAVGLAAAIATITALCGGRLWKRLSPPSPSSVHHKTAEKLDSSNLTATTMTITSQTPPSPRKAAKPAESEGTTHDKESQARELPLPPAMMPMRESQSRDRITKSSSDRNLAKNLTMKLPRSLSMARKEDNNQRKKGLNSEDSIWMKTIILGEKCKVPDEDDAVIYYGKGKRISTYHPKIPSMISLSRRGSFSEPEARPGPEGE